MIARTPGSQRLFAVIVAAVFGLGLTVAAAQQKSGTATAKKDEPQISAPHAILIDAENGSVLFEAVPTTCFFRRVSPN